MIFVLKSDESFLRNTMYSEHSYILVRVNEHTLRPLMYTHKYIYICTQKDCNGSLGDECVPQIDPDASESGVHPSLTDDDVRIMYNTGFTFLYIIMCV